MAWDVPESRSVGDTIIHGLIASGEALLSNGIVMMFNGFVMQSSWAFPTTKSIRGNFTIPWGWEDTDGFKVNNFGHPYQGSLYFNAGRVNGFGFYESVFFSAFGSFTWEAFFESNHASINDFFTTVPGSLAVGEMLYRLYIEARSAGIPAPIAFFINPMAGFHSLVTGWKPPSTGRNLFQFQTYLSGGYAQTYYSLPDNDHEIFSFKGPYTEVGFNTVYGNPFEQDTKIPYRHFELAMSFGFDLGNYMGIRVISDGYLFSFSPIYTDTNSMSMGLTFNFDFVSMGEFSIYNGTIDQSSSALNWTLKYQRIFSQNTVMQIKYHAGFTFFGVSNYYSPYKGIDLRNYGYGLNSKLFFNLDNRKLGRLDAALLGYVLLSYPGTSALSGGTVYWLFSDITYSRFVSDHISLGITNSYAMEWGLFDGFPNTWKWHNAVKLFVAWNL